ncbi:hypothetical protein BDY21DRAFT_355407 [Lineolata rhizophorae]|uniref:Uncharacterized protein n=1 Tax=Lineolata rhizophorae TaxID=578093 RepID=A0A6A6NQ90_9PEZI|nr:hypothetical protein BDY21DRAFT_355407 [Lineolata rhizophorae]
MPLCQPHHDQSAPCSSTETCAFASPLTPHWTAETPPQPSDKPAIRPRFPPLARPGRQCQFIVRGLIPALRPKDLARPRPRRFV